LIIGKNREMTEIKDKHNQKDTKHKILNAAAEMFASDGFHKVSVREICDAAGVTKPVLYYYFVDKESLLEELIHETYFHVNELKTKYFSEDNTLDQTLRNIINLYLDFTHNFPHLLRFSVVVQSTNVPPKIRELKLARYKSELLEFIKILDAAQNNGLLNKKYDTKLLAQNFLGTIIMMIAECIIFEDRQSELSDSLNKFVEFWIEQFLIKKVRSSNL